MAQGSHGASVVSSPWPSVPLHAGVSFVLLRTLRSIQPQAGHTACPWGSGSWLMVGVDDEQGLWGGVWVWPVEPPGSCVPLSREGGSEVCQPSREDNGGKNPPGPIPIISVILYRGLPQAQPIREMG